MSRTLLRGIGVSFALTLLSFPSQARSPFLWGVGHSAFQVEGSPAESDWKSWTQVPGKIKNASNADKASEFWTRYEEDFALAKRLNSNAFRISIAWDRIEPAENQWDEAALSHYEDIIENMRAHGLEPVVTLHHFVLPKWLADKKGILADDFVQQFSDYALKVVNRLSQSPGRVRYWMTFNEPMVLTHLAYLDGAWPPGHKGDAGSAIAAAAQLARAHIEAVNLIRALKNGTDIKVSVAAHWRLFEAGKGLWNAPVAMLSDWVFNRQFLRAVHTGKFFFWMPGSKVIYENVELPQGRSTLDYLGLNYYGRMITSLHWKPPFVKLHEGPGLKSDLGWEIYPQGLYEVLTTLGEYDLPILISENGLADSRDHLRSRFILDHVSAMKRAQAEGIPVIGYLHWSLTDNFEWAFGLTPRFGLVEMDYQSGKRSPRPSFHEYRKLIGQERGLQ